LQKTHKDKVNKKIILRLFRICLIFTNINQRILRSVFLFFLIQFIYIYLIKAYGNYFKQTSLLGLIHKSGSYK